MKTTIIGYIGIIEHGGYGSFPKLGVPMVTITEKQMENKMETGVV